MARLKLPEAELLAQYFIIDKDSPSGLRWKIKPSRGILAGAVAGSKHKIYGYWYVTVCGQRYRAHRLIYRMLTGEDPGEYLIDHIHGNLDDNITTRKVTPAQNLANSRPRKNNSSKFKGVCWDKQKKKWFARIAVDKSRINIGRFDCEIEAAKAYNEYALKFYGEFARLNEF